MSKYSKYLVLLMLGLASSTCKDNDDIITVNPKPTWQGPSDEWVEQAPKWVAYLLQEDSRPDWTVDLSGNEPLPEWNVPDYLKYPSSMTVVLVLPDFLQPYQSADDMIAAFIDDECRGIGDVEVVNDKTYYFINIKGGDTDKGKVVFKYYNCLLHTLYTADNDLEFQLDSVYGTVASPQQAVFKKTGKYPLEMSIEVSLGQNLGGFTAGKGDLIAVFADDECRAVSDVDPYVETHTLQVLGREDGETLTIYYYTSQHKGVLKHASTLVFEHNAVRRVVPSFRALNSVDVYLQVNAELRAYNNELSQIGIFVGEECRSYSLSLGQGRFHSMVLADNDDEVTIKYFTDELRVVFESAPIKMQELLATDENNYYTVPLVTEDRYPLLMQFVLALPPTLKASEDANDMMAAFIGDECRGVANAELSEGEMLYKMDVVRQLGESQKVTIKYYSYKTGEIYQSMPFAFEHNVAMGSELYPEYMYFNETSY